MMKSVHGPKSQLPPKAKKRKLVKSRPPKVYMPDWNDGFAALKEQRIPKYNPIVDVNAQGYIGQLKKYHKLGKYVKEVQRDVQLQPGGLRSLKVKSVMNYGNRPRDTVSNTSKEITA